MNCLDNQNSFEYDPLGYSSVEPRFLSYLKNSSAGLVRSIGVGSISVTKINLVRVWLLSGLYLTNTIVSPVSSLYSLSGLVRYTTPITVLYIFDSEDKNSTILPFGNLYSIISLTVQNTRLKLPGFQKFHQLLVGPHVLVLPIRSNRSKFSVVFIKSQKLFRV